MFSSFSDKVTQEYWINKTPKLSLILIILVVFNIDFGTQNKEHPIIANLQQFLYISFTYS